MWEIIVTYEDEGTGKRYNRAHRMSNMQFNALKTSGCLEKDIARHCEEAVQEFLWLERHELVAKLLAKTASRWTNSKLQSATGGACTTISGSRSATALVASPTARTCKKRSQTSRTVWPALNEFAAAKKIFEKFS